MRGTVGQRRFARYAELTLAQQRAGDRALIHGDEPPVELRCDRGGRAAAGEQVDDEIAGLGGGGNDAPKQRFRLLRQESGAFAVLLLQMLDVRPNVGRIDEGVLVIGVGLAVRADRKADASVVVDEALHVIAALRSARRADRGNVEQHLLALAVEEDRIVLSRIAARCASAGTICPDDFVYEVRFAENLVQEQPRLVRHAVIEVQID